MRLLITTQTLDVEDPILGFFHRWIEEIAKHCEKVIVICLREGAHDLPSNVTVLSLGKERGASRLRRIKKFFTYIRKYKHEYDAVLVHMNPEYVVLGGVLWRFWRKRVALWYVHKSVTPTLRIAHALVDVVLTASRESFRLLSHKVRVMGHGIDTESFKPGIKEGSIEMRIVTSGRIAPAKHVIEMLSVLDELHEKGEKFRFTIIGSPSTKNDEAYLRALEREISKRPYSAKVELRGPVSQREMPALLNKEDLFINLSTTGSLDKAVLEALAVGVPVVTTNEAFRDLLSPFDLYVGNRSFSAVAEAIDKIMNRPDKAAVVATLRNKIVERHSLSKLIPALLNEIGS